MAPGRNRNVLAAHPCLGQSRRIPSAVAQAATDRNAPSAAFWSLARCSTATLRTSSCPRAGVGCSVSLASASSWGKTVNSNQVPQIVQGRKVPVPPILGQKAASDDTRRCHGKGVPAARGPRAQSTRFFQDDRQAQACRHIYQWLAYDLRTAGSDVRQWQTPESWGRLNESPWQTRT